MNTDYIINVLEDRRVYYDFGKVLESSSENELNISNLVFVFDFETIHNIPLSSFKKYLDVDTLTQDGKFVASLTDDKCLLKSPLTKYEKLICQLVIEYEDENTHLIFKSKTFELYFNPSVNASTPAEEFEVITLNSVVERMANIESHLDEIVAGEDKNFLYVQNTPSDTWNIKHDLNKYPSATVIDSSGSEVIGEVEYIDLNNITIKFKGSFSGKCTLN